MQTTTGQEKQAPPAENITVADLKKLCEDAHAQAQEVERISLQLAPEAKKLAELNFKIQTCLEHLELEKFAIPGYGTYFLKDNFSVKVPKLEDDRNAFFGYLKERKIFDSMITVNSATLNGWYKQELADLVERAERGEDVDPDFKIPGIAEPSEYKSLQFRKETTRGSSKKSKPKKGKLS